jgi:hypothetical protein
MRKPLENSDPTCPSTCLARARSRASEITPLTRRNMAQRRIPESWVRNALANSEPIVAGDGGRWVAHTRVTMADKERLLRVVYEETESAYVVVTADLTSDITR